MSRFNFNNKSFKLLDNSSSGKASEKTIFEYQQTENFVTADYSGGEIIYGKIIAKLEGDQLHMLYNCLTREEELKAGKAIAKVSHTNIGKIKLELNWRWLESDKKGLSTYVEI